MDTFNNKKLFETENHWKTLQLDEKTQNKINVFRSLIPKNLNEILDLGCGNGVVTNALSDDFSVIGLDRSFVSLQHLKNNYHRIPS